MDEKIKQRIIGAVILIVLFVVFIPLLFSGSKKAAQTRDNEISSVAPEASVADLNQPPGVALNTAHASNQLVAVIPKVMPTSPVINKHPISAQNTVKTFTKMPVANQSTVEHKNLHSVRSKKIEMPSKVWIIKLASFSSVKHADNLMHKLEKNKYASFRKTSKEGQRLLYRVYVGPEKDWHTADQIARRLQKSYHLQGIIIKYEP